MVIVWVQIKLGIIVKRLFEAERQRAIRQPIIGMVVDGKSASKQTEKLECCLRSRGENEAAP